MGGASGSGLRPGPGLVVTGWRLFCLRPPRVVPVGDAREEANETGRFRFDVGFGLPLWLGHVVRYRAWLAPEDDGGCGRPAPGGS